MIKDFTVYLAGAKDVALIFEDMKIPVILDGITTSSYPGARVEFEGHMVYGAPIYKNTNVKRPTIKNVIFNPPATIVFWTDGTKTVVKCQDGDEFDPEKGIAMAYIKKVNSDKGNYNEIFKPWVEKYYKDFEEAEQHKEAIRRSVYRNIANSIFGMYGQYKPKCAPYVGDLDYKNEVEALKKQFEFVNKIMTDASLYPLPLSGLIKDDNVGIKKPEPVEPSSYDDDKYERALKYFEENMADGPCPIPYCEDCGAQLVAIEAIRRCLKNDKKEKENA